MQVIGEFQRQGAVSRHQGARHADRQIVLIVIAPCGQAGRRRIGEVIGANPQGGRIDGGGIFIAADVEIGMGRHMHQVTGLGR